MHSKEINLKIDFIGVGIERSGTSWIFECLREHPNLCVSKYKEVDFFKDDDKFKQGLEYYKSFFNHCDNNKKIGEFSPRYFFSPMVPERIKKFFPDVKLIIVLRNPIEKTYSLYRMKSSYKSLPHKTFEDFIKDQRYIQRGFYADKLKEWLSFFNRENVLIMVYEDLKSNPSEYIKKIYNFLGVNSSFVPKILNKVHNSPELRSPLKQFVFTFLSIIKRKIFMSFSLGRRFVYFFQKTGLYCRLEYFFAKSEKKNKKRPPIKKETREYLQKLFANDIKNLEKIINRDLSYWK